LNRSPPSLRASWLRGFSLTRSATKSAVLARSARLRRAPMRAHESRGADDIDRCPRCGRKARDADSRLWSTVGMCLEVCGQHGPNRTFGLRMRVGSGIDGQPGYVGAHGAAVFGFKDNRIELCHSTPASRRMRLPSRPASFFV
jgi:predicted RNA-binding Zn-ribbon protein involved in translation (DUF1610 family)